MVKVERPAEVAKPVSSATAGEGAKMFGKLRETIAANPPREVGALIKLMGTVVIDDQYLALVNKVLSTSPQFTERKSLLEAGHFLGSDLVKLVHASGDGNGTSVHIVGSLLDRLVEWMLVSDVGVLIPNGCVRYQWNQKQIALFIALHCLDNVLLGQSYVAQKYCQSVPSIFVRNGGDDYTGTGLLSDQSRQFSAVCYRNGQAQR